MSRDYLLFAWGMFTAMGAGAFVDSRWLAAAVLFGFGVMFRAMAGERPRA